MKTILTAAFLLALALPAYAAVSDQQEQAYDQTYKSDKAHETFLKEHDGLKR